MPQTLQQESLIVALSKYAIKIGIEKISEKFNCFVLKPFLCQQGRFTKIRSHIAIYMTSEGAQHPKESVYISVISHISSNRVITIIMYHTLVVESIVGVGIIVKL